MRRILVIGPSNIGDTLLMAGVVDALHRRYPGAHMTLVVGPRATPLFADDPRIHTLVDAGLYDSPLQRLRLAAALWRYRPSIVVDLRHTLYPLLLKPLSAWRYYLRQPPRSLVHMRDRHLWKLNAQIPGLTHVIAGPGPALRTARRGESAGELLRMTDKDAAQLEGLFRRWRFDETSRVVVICPGARSHIKRWTAEGFARVADRLIAEAACDVVFAGEPDEKPVIEEILGLMERRAHSAVGLTTMRQLGLVMRRAALVITNDSASLHLASALEAPTVAIFGPTDARKYGPTSARSRVIRRRLFCAPCEQALCRFNHECMRFIAPDEVYDAAKQLLGARG